jgi:hypothetical protein
MTTDRKPFQGRCLNKTGELLGVYGPRLPSDPTGKDNRLYKLPTGRATPDGFDCDGIFVPNDRIADQRVGPDIPGPVAVKYVDITPPFAIVKSGNKYDCPPNQGVFKAGEINWHIPNVAQSAVASFPEVPNHVPID